MICIFAPKSKKHSKYEKHKTNDGVGGAGMRRHYECAD